MNNRLNAIATFAQKRDEEIANKKKREEEKEEYLKQTILGWHDRIQQLIETANACVEHGIKIECSYSGERNYEHGHFITDAVSHILGFEYYGRRREIITRIGKRGGGACYFDVFTDGKTIDATGTERLWALQRFVDDFDRFESMFYAYVDSVCASK